MEKRSTIRTVYLYLFAVVGLVLLIIGGVRFIDMGLKAFVFTQSDAEQRLYSMQPPMMYPVEKLEDIQQEGELTEQEKEAIGRWLLDYEQWEEQREAVDPVTANRHRNASINLAMILVGLPIYIYHWGTIKKESRPNQEK